MILWNIHFKIRFILKKNIITIKNTHFFCFVLFLAVVEHRINMFDIENFFFFGDHKLSFFACCWSLLHKHKKGASQPANGQISFGETNGKK